MIILLSPAKTIQLNRYSTNLTPSIPLFNKEAFDLVKQIQKMSFAELQNILDVSDKLAVLNFERYKSFSESYHPSNSKPSILAFSGEVYEGLEAWTFNDHQMMEAHKKVRILSGLYGILKPLDLIQAYRLELSCKMKPIEYNDLYEYWKDKILKAIIDDLNLYKTDVILNLASLEYSKVVDFKKLDVKVKTPKFKNYRNNEYKIVSIYAKKARGLMTSFVIKNSIDDINDIIGFDFGGYYYNQELSNETEPNFISEF